MAPYLQLDLNTITIDPRLAEQIPYALSSYYLVLPLGRENGSVSLAMAYPDNEKAQRILGRLLRAEVVPLFTPAELLQPLLERIYHQEGTPAAPIVATCDRPERQASVEAAAAVLSGALGSEVTFLPLQSAAPAEMPQLPGGGQARLLVCPLPPKARLATLLARSAAPLFFVPGRPRPLRRILAVMRGFASDVRTLEWLAPLARAQEADLTLLLLPAGLHPHLAFYHNRESPAARHLDLCLRRLEAGGVRAGLKFRQGRALGQVAAEVAGGGYDLLALAAEGDGDFARQVIEAAAAGGSEQAVFVLKPPLWPGNEADLSQGDERI